MRREVFKRRIWKLPIFNAVQSYVENPLLTNVLQNIPTEQELVEGRSMLDCYPIVMLYLHCHPEDPLMRQCPPSETLSYLILSYLS